MCYPSSPCPSSIPTIPLARAPKPRAHHHPLHPLSPRGMILAHQTKRPTRAVSSRPRRWADRRCRSKRTQGRAAGEPWGCWLANPQQPAGTGGKPGGNRGRMDTWLWDHKLVKATWDSGAGDQRRLAPARPGSSGPTLIVDGALVTRLSSNQTVGPLLAIASDTLPGFSPCPGEPCTGDAVRYIVPTVFFFFFLFRG